MQKHIAMLTPLTPLTVRFGAGISSGDIILRPGSLMLDLGSGDEIHIENFDRNNVGNGSSFSSFEFEDGTRLTTDELVARGFDIEGTAYNDNLYGRDTDASNDISWGIAA